VRAPRWDALVRPLLVLVVVLCACRPEPQPLDLPRPSGVGTPGLGFFHEGGATIRLGPERFELGLSGAPSTYAAGMLSLSYGELGSGRSLNITGPAREGENRTGPNLSLSIGTDERTYEARDGGCVILVERAGPRGVDGSFRCRRLAGDGVRARASGTFRASA